LQIPLIAITGTNGKTTVTLLLDRIYRDAGYRVGSASSDGVRHDGKRIRRADDSGSYGLWLATRCPGLELLVAETARGGILRFGFGYRESQAGIVLNVENDHIGALGIADLDQMAAVKSGVARRVEAGGALVLNADDPRVRAMADKTKAPATFFSLEGRRDFERGFYLDGEAIWQKDGSECRPFVPVREVGLCWNGLRPCNLANVMAAVACVEGLQGRLPVGRESLLGTLRRFGQAPDDVPRRASAYSWRGVDVMLCDCKNPASCRVEQPFQAEIQRRGGYDHVIGIASDKGNRRDTDGLEMARLMEPLCDAFIVCPPVRRLLRGLSAEEVVCRIASRFPADKLLAAGCRSLREALELAVRHRKGRTLVVVLFSNVMDNRDLERIEREGMPLPWPCGIEERGQ